MRSKYLKILKRQEIITLNQLVACIDHFGAHGLDICLVVSGLEEAQNASHIIAVIDVNNTAPRREVCL
jgi:hypothetical protein